MIHMTVNHSYDVKWSDKIMSGIIAMIYITVNHSYDLKWSYKIMSGIICLFDLFERGKSSNAVGCHF